MKKSLNDWLDEYSKAHQNSANITIHKVAVPLILISTTGLLTYLGKGLLPEVKLLSGGNILIFAMLIWYATVDRRLPRIMAPFLFLAAATTTYIDRTYSDLLGPLNLVVFILSWIAQFIGHQREGNKPSFFRQVQFLLIGPVWIMVSLRRRLGDVNI